MAANDDYVIELLTNNGLVSAEDVYDAQNRAMLEGASSVDILISEGKVTREIILQSLANDCGMDFMPEIESVDEDALKLIPRAQAKRYNVIPLYREHDALVVAISDPLDFETLDALRYLLKMDISAVVVPLERIQEAQARYYGSVDETVESLIENYQGAELEVVDSRKGNESTEDAPAEDDAPIIRMVHGIILDAYRLKASDIHLEPLERRLRLRYRMDGVLQEMRDPPKRLQSAIISRLKIMANISIAEKRLPQDGRIALALQDGNQIDLRVSTIPTVHGESIVMRILDKSSLNIGLPELGFFADDQATIERILGYPDGIFLVTGPTGSGKSTTLYACLNALNKPDRKIITVEDPVEYDVPGINQVQVREEVGMTFASALRAMLRQAPNIIMVGEIRDAETAAIAINASLTGHLVFSTLHTNDAPSAVTRLVDIGIKPFLVSSSIRAVMAQRLIRKVCSECAQPYAPTAEELRALNLDRAQLSEARFRKGHGCDRCRGSGYRGRSGIFEIFTVTDEIRTLINDGASVSTIRQRARDLGMRTLREDGIRKVVAGITTPEEVISITMGDKD